MPLARYAAHPEQSRGRAYQEAPPQGRNEFQRDRDRIIHSSAFRRLEYKTQVFVNHEGDLFRTRLTHSLEVAQIARSIARTLHLHEDLTEGIAIAHDLGHTPFGHAGQDALNACMKEFGGFEHNLQSLRVVDHLEQRYAEFDGLNLSFEMREGILKHCAVKEAKTLGDVGERFIAKTHPSLEAQLTNYADELAYNNHDIDDGLRSGLITLEQLQEIALFAHHFQEVKARYHNLGQRRLIHETIRRMINTQVLDLCAQSQHNIEQAAPNSIDDVRASAPLIAFSPAMTQHQLEMKRFLRKNLYQHYKVARMSAKAKTIIHDLFWLFMEQPELLPNEYQLEQDLKNKQHETTNTLQDTQSLMARNIADYIAGMTDRFAIKEHIRLFSISAEW